MKVLKKLKVFLIYVLADKRGEYKFHIKGHEVEATFTDEPNPQIVPRLREILLGDAKAPAYKAARTKPKEERTWNIDMDKVRAHIPAEIPDEEMEDYTAEALRVYHDYLKKKKVRDVR